MNIPKGGNHNPYMEEEQTTQWPKERVQKDKQRSTKDAHKTKDRVTQTSQKTGGELMCIEISGFIQLIEKKDFIILYKGLF